MKRYCIKKVSFILFHCFLFFPFMAHALQDTNQLPSKYRAGIESIVKSHEYIKTHQAPNWWKLNPYYIPQRNESSCSLAVATMIVNAARSNKVPDELATQDKLLALVNDKGWDDGVKPDGEGVTLDELGALIPKALNAYGVKGFTVQVIHTSNTDKKTADTLHKKLVQSEKGQVFIIANFDQGFFSGTQGGGHFAPIGAYDTQRKRVLLMDPDREYFEPYWVPEQLLLKSMATRDDETKTFRGYMVIKLDI